MGLGRKVDDRTRAVLRQQAIQQRAVADVALHKDVARIAAQAVEVVQVARVGQLVEVHDRFALAGKPVEHEIGTNEAGATSDENHEMREAGKEAGDYPTLPRARPRLRSGCPASSA